MYFKLFILILVSFIAAPSSLQAKKSRIATHLPTYAEIVKDVKFWERIFSKYSSTQCVFHDSEDLTINYDVKNLPKSRISRRAVIKKHHKKIKKALIHLAKHKSMAKDSFHLKIKKALPKSLRTKAGYLKVSKRIRCQTGISDNFKVALKKSQRHLPHIKKVAKRLGLPPDIVYLPHLESGFNNNARSKVGALGLWQLMSYKAREGGLRVDRRMDERKNIKKATKLALSEIKKYHEKTGAWGLALTSYNYGINGVMRAIKKYKTTHYPTIRRKHKTRIFGFASKNFYPSFLAVRNLAKKYENDLAKKRRDTRQRIAKN